MKMETVKVKELRQQEQSTLQTKLKECENQLLQLRLKHGNGQVRSTHLLRQLRRDIARLKTLLTESQKKGEQP